jgi:membrane protein YdbS with pleckstrin-like domain
MLVLPFGAVLYGLAMPGPADPVPRSPSPRLWRMRSLQLAGSAVAGALLAATGAGLAAGAPAGAAAAALVVAAAALAAWFVRRRVRAWSYTERDEDLLVSRGVLVRRLSVVPYGRMQFVDVTAGPVERAFRLATVKLHTAAAASDARIPGLERDEAARLRDRLAALGEAKAAGL